MMDNRDEVAGLAEAEMRAMVRAYLGDGYDSSKVQALVDDQRRLQRRQQQLLDRYERGELTAYDYASGVNALSRESAGVCRRILGAEDFDRLFGYVPDEIVDAREFAAIEESKLEDGGRQIGSRGTAPTQSGPIVAGAQAFTKAPTEQLTRDKLTDMLLAIVEEKTGYPCDMVGLDQNLELDLGIDSVKRIEIARAMLQMLPATHRDALVDSRSNLDTQATLNGMLDLLTQVTLATGVKAGA